MTDVEPFLFRQLMGRFTTGVVVITTKRDDGSPIGMTANSLASVSLRPPLLSVCIEQPTELHGAMLSAPAFAINILAEDQEGLSRRFAAPHDDRFDGVGYQLSEQGLVLLDGAIAHIECERHAQFPAGDHTIIVGRVTGGATHEGRPLLYYRGGYGTLG